MNAIDEIKDEAIRKIALTLRSSGLASSETEAVRMAMMMSKTSQRVTQNFDQKKNTNPTSGFPHQPSTSNPQAQVFNQMNNIHTSTSVQEKPRKAEEKEEFIFGEVQEKETAQKKDVYKVENEFEEIIVQEVIITKDIAKDSRTLSQIVEPAQRPVQQPIQHPVQETKPVSKPATNMFNGRPSMFGSGTLAQTMSQAEQQDLLNLKLPAQQVHVQETVRVQPVHQEAPVRAQPVVHAQPIHTQQVSSSQVPVQRQSPTPSQAPVTAAGSAQMAFASLLGDIQKVQAHHQEPKPAVQSSPAQASPSQKPVEVHQPEAQQVQQVASQHAPQSAPRPMNHAPDPRANMMKGVDVDLTKMFNVNK